MSPALASADQVHQGAQDGCQERAHCREGLINSLPWFVSLMILLTSDSKTETQKTVMNSFLTSN